MAKIDIRPLTKKEAVRKLSEISSGPKTILNSKLDFNLLGDIQEVLEKKVDIKTPYEQERETILQAIESDNHFSFNDPLGISEENINYKLSNADKPIPKFTATIIFADGTDVIHYYTVKVFPEYGSFFYDENNQTVAYLPVGIPWIKR